MNHSLEIPRSLSRKIPPGPKGHFLLGNLFELKKSPSNRLVQWAREFEDILLIRLGPRVLYFLNHPDYVKHVLQENYKNYGKRTRGWNKLRPLFGEGLLTSDGPTWFRQRRTMQPGFHRQKIASFAEVMAREAQAMVERWSPYARDGTPINVAEEMMGITFKVVAATLFSEDVHEEIETVGRGLTAILHYASESYTRIFDLPLWFPTRRNRKVCKALDSLNQIVFKIIQSRRRNQSHNGDLLAMLMEVKDPETGKGMSDQEIRDQVMTLFMTGHETTAVTLTWTWYLLSKNPAVERKLRSELQEVLGDRLPTFEDLPKLKYTTCVFKEALRLYPPVWVFSRRALQEDEIDGYRIPAGSTVFVSPYVMHRHTRYWENPEGFDPERFASGKSEELPAFAYMPFGGGPRLCIGRDFAMMEAPIILAIVAQHYRLNLLSGHPVEEEPSITLRSRYGMMMNLSPIKASLGRTFGS